MDKFIIHGGRPLAGEIEISGAKNAALPILAATILATDHVTLHNVPDLKDVQTMKQLLINLGMQIDAQDNTALRLNANEIRQFLAPYDLVKTMRASVLVLGPLLARFENIPLNVT